MADSTHRKGVSLAKGPIGLLGLIGVLYGITALIFAGHGFAAHPLNGTVTGKHWIGLEVNGWSSLLFIAAGGLLLLSAPLHWGAKSMAMIVAVALAAAAVIALIQGHGALGILAANGLTKLVWGAAAVVLFFLALLPRVGGNRHDADRRDARRREPDSRDAPSPAASTTATERRREPASTRDADGASERAREPASSYAADTTGERPNDRSGERP